jgi:hypothetical protein
MSFEYPNDTFIMYELASRSFQKSSMDLSTGALVYAEGGSVLFSPSDCVIVYDAKGKVIRKWESNGQTETGSLTAPAPGLDMLHTGKFVECVRAGDTRTYAPAPDAAMTSYMPLVANIALDIRKPVELDPRTGALLTKEARPLWAREYEKGWELEA